MIRIYEYLTGCVTVIDQLKQTQSDAIQCSQIFGMFPDVYVSFLYYSYSRFMYQNESIACIFQLQ